MSKLLASLCLVLGSMSVATAATDAAVENRLYIVDPNATVTITFQYALANTLSSLWVTSKDSSGAFAQDWQQIFTVNNIDTSKQTVSGTKFTGSFKGSELVFMLVAPKTGGVYFSGGPSEDGFDHTQVSYNDYYKLATVKFEDGHKGGDMDFNDIVFQVSNVSGKPLGGPLPAIPEPETYAMMLAGLGLISAVARRRTKRA